MGYTLHISRSNPIQNPLIWQISDPVQSKSAWTGLDYESSGLIQSIPYSGCRREPPAIGTSGWLSSERGPGRTHVLVTNPHRSSSSSPSAAPTPPGRRRSSSQLSQAARDGASVAALGRDLSTAGTSQTPLSDEVWRRGRRRLTPIQNDPPRLR